MVKYSTMPTSTSQTVVPHREKNVNNKGQELRIDYSARPPYSLSDVLLPSHRTLGLWDTVIQSAVNGLKNSIKSHTGDVDSTIYTD